MDREMININEIKLRKLNFQNLKRMEKVFK